MYRTCRSQAGRIGRSPGGTRSSGTLLGVDRLDRHAPLCIVDVEVRRDGLAVVADGVEHAGHRVDEQPPCVRLIEDEVHPRRLAVRIRNRRELRELHGDDAVDRDRRRERIIASARSGGHRPAHGRARLRHPAVLADPAGHLAEPEAPPVDSGRGVESRRRSPRG